MAFYVQKTVYPTITTNKMTNPSPKKSRRSNSKSSNSNRSKRELAGFLQNEPFNEESLINVSQYEEGFTPEIELSEKKMRQIKERDWAIRMNNISYTSSDNDSE